MTGLTPAEERLRSLVPDDPVKLPADHLPCEGCGRAVAAPAVIATESPFNRRTAPVEFTRCPECQALHDAADGYVTDHPLLARRLGDRIAREHIEGVLLGLAILGKDAPADLGFLLPRMTVPCSVVRFRNPVTLTYGLCSPYPFAHVTTRQRAALRNACAAVLRDRLALSAQPVPIRCPTRACLLCGIPTVARSALEVARRGGVEAATVAVWREVRTASERGHVCPACADAIEAEGSVGPSAVNRAVIAHVGVSSTLKARRLRSLLADECLPSLPGWGSLRGAKPNAAPFDHLRRVIDRL